MGRKELRIFSVLFFSIFSAVTGVGIVIPLLPVYAHDLGASGLYISLIFGSFSISRTFLLPYFGRMSDRRGRKPYIVFGLFCYAVVSLGFIMASSVDTLIFLRFFQGIASAMIMPVAQAYVGDITPEGKEGFYMGLFSMAMFLSLSLGPFMGGVIHSRFGLDAAFLGMGILAGVAFLFSFIFLPPVHLEHVSTTPRKAESWSVILSDRVMLGLFSFRFVYTTCVGVIWCFLPLFAATEFQLDSSATGTLVMLMVLIGGIFHTPMGYLADRMNKPLLVIGGGIIIAVSMAIIEWADGFNFLLTAVLLFGLGGGISLPALSAMAVTEGKRVDALGSVMALLTMAHSLGMLLGSLIAGLTMDYFDLNHAFPVGALIMAGGLVFFIWCIFARND
ncbi:MFS transporter [Desulfatiferula olefinivorans]